MGIGDWGLGIGPNPQSPIPNPQSPIPNYSVKIIFINKNFLNENIYLYIKIFINYINHILI